MEVIIMPGINDFSRDFSKSLDMSLKFVKDGAKEIAKDMKKYVDGRPIEPSIQEAKRRMDLFPAPPFLATKGENFRLGKQVANGVFAVTLGLLMAPGYAVTAAYINSLNRNKEQLTAKREELIINMNTSGPTSKELREMSKDNIKLKNIESQLGMLNAAGRMLNPEKPPAETISQLSSINSNNNSLSVGSSKIPSDDEYESAQDVIIVDYYVGSIKENINLGNSEGVSEDLQRYNDLTDKQKLNYIGKLATAFTEFGKEGPGKEDPNKEIRELLLDVNNPIGRDFEKVVVNGHMTGLEFMRNYTEFSNPATTEERKVVLRSEMKNDEEANITGSQRRLMNSDNDDSKFEEVFKDLSNGLGGEVKYQQNSPSSSGLNLKEPTVINKKDQEAFDKLFENL